MTQCEFFLIQYVPSPGADLRLPIGLILLDGAGRLVRHGTMRQWKTVRCLDPRADLALLESLLGVVGQMVAENPSAWADGGLRRSLLRMVEANWGALQIAPPQGVETENPEQEFDRLFEEHVEGRRPVLRHAAPRAGTRRWIQAQLRESLERQQLLNRVRHSILVEEFTAPGDGFRIDYSYQPNGLVKYIHALSLQHDWNQAKVLSYTFGKIRERSRAAMTAVVADSGADLPMAESCRRILLDSEIAVQPLSGLDGFLEQMRRELSPGVS